MNTGMDAVGAEIKLAALKLLLRMALDAPAIGELEPEEREVAALLTAGYDEDRICATLNMPLPDLAWALVRLAS